MSQILVNVLAWLIVHAGISVPGFQALEDIGFNQPVPCQFDFLSSHDDSTVFPAVNRREQLRGVVVIVQLPAPVAISNPPGVSAGSALFGSWNQWISGGVAVGIDASRDGLLRIADRAADLSSWVGEYQAVSLVKLVHPFSGHLKSGSQNKVREWSRLVRTVDLNRIVERIRSGMVGLSLYSGSPSDDYWIYYRDCDRWGVVWKRDGSSDRPESSIVNVSRLMGTVSKATGMVVRILVPVSAEWDWLMNNGERMLDVSRSAMAWWQAVIFEELKPSLSAVFQTRISWR